MKKLLFFACTLVAVLALCLTGCKKQQNENSAATKTDADIKTFTVGFDAEFPPYGYRNDNGEYVGFDLDLAREVCKRNNWKFVASPINWDAKDTELNSGNIDCIWNGFTMEKRENDYTWTKPYCENVQVVMVLKDSPINTLADLNGKIVAAQTDTPILKALSEGGDLYEKIGKTFKKIVVTPSYNNAVQELQTGAVEAIAMDNGVAQGKLESGNYRILKETLMNEHYGIGFKKGNTELKDKVEATLIEMVKDGTAGKISAKYFKGEDVLIIGKGK